MSYSELSENCTIAKLTNLLEPIVYKYNSLQEVEHSKRLSKVRIHVELLIGLHKNKFTLLQSTLQITMVKHMSDSDFSNIDKFLTVCSALVSLGPSVVPL